MVRGEPWAGVDSALPHPFLRRLGPQGTVQAHRCNVCLYLLGISF